MWPRALALASLAGCGDAITLEIASDRPIPTAIDAICVGVGDTAPGGGQFGKRYALADKLASLPQTLRVEPGRADAAWAWVRGDRGGVPAVRAERGVDFGDDITLALDRCQRGGSGAPSVIGDPAGPAAARLVVSHGVAGARVIAVADGASAILDVSGGALVATDGPPIAGNVLALEALDLDGDCDDDVIVATSAGPPAIWRRDGTTFVEAGALGETAVAAVGFADVDRDQDIDVVTGSGGALTLWRNDGSGTFAPDPAALSAAGRVSSIRALALGDLDGDGNPDLVVGQAGDPLEAWLGEQTGSFQPADAVVPAVPLDVARLSLADVDGDFDPDLAVAVTGAPLRLYIDREGLLEDQTFVRFPDVVLARATAFGGFDGGCEPDAVIAGDPDTLVLRGQDGGMFAADAMLPPATDAVLVDLDRDGDLDAILSTAEGARWVAR
ncbi:MAG TPA: VCBS repeat-containing protein [Kofleriaceae bacterium]|nr:VCBS repeat-containing protein [Kofleriaceae bacterium]